LLLGANTPWNRVTLTHGFGTRAASLALKSSGSNIMCVVPSLQAKLHELRMQSDIDAADLKTAWTGVV
jgi:hypothetical protein